MKKSILELKQAGKTFAAPSGPVTALRDISLTLNAGDFIAVQGPSGSGKSTLLFLAGGLLRPTSGSVSVNGEDLYALSPDARSRFRAARIGLVFQQFHLLPYFSVLDNILAPALAVATGEKAALKKRAMELLERFGLAHRAEHIPAALSTGERQRTALARALLRSPNLLLADEPTGNLDPENSQIILTAFREFATAGGCILLVTHDPLAAAAADRGIQLQDGRNIQ